MKRNINLLIYIISVALLINSCSSGKKDNIKDGNDLSIIFLNDTIVTYNGLLNEKTKLERIKFDTSAIKEIIKKNKNQYKDKLYVLLKFTSDMRFLEPASQVIDILKKSDIRFRGWEPDSADRRYFKTESFSWQPPMPIQITTPVNTISNTQNQNNSSVLFTLIKKNRLFFEYSDSVKTYGKHEIIPFSASHIDSTLGKLEKTHNIYLPSVKIMIKADGDVKYKNFEELVNGLKRKKINKYTLVQEK